jgi:hypothetical protein
MGDVITDLLPLIVGATAVPFYPIVVLVLLQGQGELIKALAFVTGNIAVRLAQGILFGIILGVALAANSEDGQRLGVSTLLLFVGILLLITAVKKWQKAEDPDAPPPQSLVLTPFLACAVAPQQAARPLKAAQSWLERRNRVIVIAVSLVFGVWFSYKGASG